MPSTIATVVGETGPEFVFNRLTARCDSCNAQAFVRFAKEGNDLLFCKHHSNRYELALDFQGFVKTDDESSSINEKPSPSASNQEGDE